MNIEKIKGICKYAGPSTDNLFSDKSQYSPKSISDSKNAVLDNTTNYNYTFSNNETVIAATERKMKYIYST